MANMKLYTMVDFPDDAGVAVYTEEMVDSLNRQLAEFGFKRVCFQYYGNRDYGWCMNCDDPSRKNEKKTSELMPEYARVFAEAAQRYGMEAGAPMRPQEQGVWRTRAPNQTRDIQSGVPCIGGKMLIVSRFLEQNQNLRIKRRSWDVDLDAESKIIGSVKLYKQNNIPSRIKKENITIYTSPDNSYYKPYTGDFTFTVSEEVAAEDVYFSVGGVDYGPDTASTEHYGGRLVTPKGATIQVITISGLHITDRYVAIGARCEGKCSSQERFVNTISNGIACFEPDGTKICATPGGNRLYIIDKTLDSGFNFNDGFGAYRGYALDPDDNVEGYFAIAKGKDLYDHGALCECEPAVQEYWLSLLEEALDDGFDIIGNRIENHSVHVDEPFAYGYNDCIKEEYYKRYGMCDEKDMDLTKIAKIRGDAYTSLFVEGARRIRERGKKVYLTLNIEMLHDPIPLERRYAYPMNVEWQWERWLEEIKPDEINFRMYYNSIQYLLTDPQCKKMIEVAKSYGVPMTVERYNYWDVVAEYKMLNDTGLFDAMIIYETANMFRGTNEGTVEITDKAKEYLPRLKEMSEAK